MIKQGVVAVLTNARNIFVLTAYLLGKRQANAVAFPDGEWTEVKLDETEKGMLRRNLLKELRALLAIVDPPHTKLQRLAAEMTELAAQAFTCQDDSGKRVFLCHEMIQATWNELREFNRARDDAKTPDSPPVAVSPEGQAQMITLAPPSD